MTTTQPPTIPLRVRRILGHCARFREGVDVIPTPAGVELRHPWGHHLLRGLSPREVEQLQQLNLTRVDARDIAGTRIRSVLANLANLFAVTLTTPGGAPIVTAVPINRRAGVLDIRPLGNERLRLSRFATLHVVDHGEMVLESPVSAHRLVLHDPKIVTFVTTLDGTTPLRESIARAGVDVTTAVVTSQLLQAAALLDQVDARMPMWEFQDLLFHQRSRYGLHDHPGGGTFTHGDVAHPPPVRAIARGQESIDLSVPTWAGVVAAEPSFTEVVESRHSVRNYAEEAITREQLAELLYRTARVRDVSLSGGEHPYLGVDRPYPSGGGLGELEIYPIVHDARDLDPGVYRYDSGGHRLVCIDSDRRDRAAMAAQAWLATGSQVDRPQVQLVITSRLDRVQWKYSAIAYALTLKHCGILMQNLYLVSTAMGLSPCANGSGDSEMISRVLGVDWADEPAVGEFLLGGAPAAPRAPRIEFQDVVSRYR